MKDVVVGAQVSHRPKGVDNGIECVVESRFRTGLHGPTFRRNYVEADWRKRRSISWAFPPPPHSSDLSFLWGVLTITQSQVTN